MVSLTTPGCPIRSHFQEAVTQKVSELEGVTGVAVAFDVLNARREAAPPAEAWPQPAPRGRAGPGQQRDLRRLRQGRRGQVHGDRQPGGRAGDRGSCGRRARRGRLGLQHPAHARRRRQAARLRAAQDPPDRSRRRREGDVDRILRRGRRRRGVARADAAQGDPAVPRGRRLGRARLPAGRPAARHRRRLDDPCAAAAAGQDAARDHPAASRTEGRPPRGRDGRQVRPRRSSAWSRTCPASRLPTAAATRSSARAGASCSQTRSTCRCWGRFRFRRSCACRPTRALPLVVHDPDAPAAQALAHLARGIVAATPRELPVIQMAAIAAAPGFGGKELPVIQ